MPQRKPQTSHGSWKLPDPEWLSHALLVAVVFELVIYRLAGRVLRPGGDTEPERWHQLLETLGLYIFHLSSVLAAATLLVSALSIGRDRRLPQALTIALGVAVMVLLGYAIVGLVTTPGLRTSFLLEMGYATVVIVCVAGFAFRSGDIGVRVGMVFLCLPLLVHAAHTVAMTFYGDELLLSDLPMTLERWGIWTMILAGSASPYCFGPRPFFRSAARPVPIVLGASVGLLGVLIIKNHYEVGVTLASYGLGVDLGAGLPPHEMALAILSLAAITWTVVATLTAPTSSRRLIGVGLTLILIAGYGFRWPLQFLVGAVGVLLIGRSGQLTVREESGATPSPGYRPPPISEETWLDYAKALAANLEAAGATQVQLVSGGSPEERHTHLLATVESVDVKLTVTRENESISEIAIRCESPPASDNPAKMTLYARPERRVGTHPLPPACSQPVATTGDDDFDRRFECHGSRRLIETLLDSSFRERAVALLDGWLAIWPGQGTLFVVRPGQGAPLDNPIPITELAFRGHNANAPVERVSTLVMTLADLCARAQTASHES